MSVGGEQWSWGAVPTADGATRFRLWAPGQRRLYLKSETTGATLAMHAVGDGWFERVTDAVKIGAGYRFVLESGEAVPDPASRAQFGDVHGASVVVDHDSYVWAETGWRGRPWHEAVIYEMHTGTFTEVGTFAGIESRLDHLIDLGVSAIELMPIAQFSGTRGWGYDGVLMYAPHNAYGRPDDLKRLVDAAHARGLMVLLDVVYNHFGPDGNYLHAVAPDFFDRARETPWGAAIDYTQPAVRAFAIENALYWLDMYRLDGLRLDAINQIEDASTPHVLEELAIAVRARFPDRHIHLTTEDDTNRTALHERDRDGCAKLYTGEWNDDFHHVAHVAATGETEGYYADYNTPATRLARTLAQGFAYQGEPSKAWGGQPRGSPSAHLPPTAFIDFIQNHDQIGNRAFGERLSVLASVTAVEALTALLLLSPHVPLLFMGEEWGETRPFLFFTDFSDGLADAVREGRRREFRVWKAFSDPEARRRIPDPNAVETFSASKIDWLTAKTSVGQARLSLLRHLLELRAREIVPRSADVGGHAALLEDTEGEAVHVAWRLAGGAILSITINLSAEAASPPRSTLEGGGGVPAFEREAVIFALPDGAAEDLAESGLRGWSIVAALHEAPSRDPRPKVDAS